MILASQLIICIIKITPTVRALRLGSARVICLFCVENTDDDSVAERFADSSPNPEITVIRQMPGDIIDECISRLDKRDTDLLEGIIGFCSECFANKKTLSYDELADLYQYTDEASIFRAYSKARERCSRWRGSRRKIVVWS